MRSKYEEKLYLTKEEDSLIGDFVDFIWEVRDVAQSNVLQECSSVMLETLNVLCEHTALEEDSKE